MIDITKLPDAHLRVFDRPSVPPPDRIKDVYLIGICGTAMATLAAMLKRRGLDVRGSDQDVYPPMSDFLRTEGIAVLEGYAADRIGADLDLVVVRLGKTPAELKPNLDVWLTALVDALRPG